MLLGDANAFQEYARDYYAISSDYPQIKSKTLISDDLRKISAENANVYKVVEGEKQQVRASIKPLNVTITNPETPVLYYIISEILSGEVFGKTDIFIRLYTEDKSDKIEGLRMEIEDLASIKLRNIKIVNNAVEAFTNCDYAILFDELKRTGESSKTFHNPYVSLAKNIDQYANSSCKILITPLVSRSEIYALVNVFSKHLKRINPKKNLIGNSMCEEMLVKAVLAHRLKINPAYVKNILIIGQSLKDSFYVDLSYGKVTDYDGAVWARTNTHSLNLVNMVADRDWIRKEFLALVQERGNFSILFEFKKLTNIFSLFLKKKLLVKK
jgi:hypothetical protein